MRLHPGGGIKLNNRYDSIIVGAGPAGMTAAIYIEEGRGKWKEKPSHSSPARKGRHRRTLLLEKDDRVGRKILVTGNGRCNITNLDQKPEYYRSDAPGKAWSIFLKFNETEILALMKKLGILTKDREGYVYPYNDQASTVREAFEKYLQSLPGLAIRTGLRVKRLKWDPLSELFEVKAASEGGTQSFFAPTVIIATGGFAGAPAGAGGDGFRFAGKAGHNLVPPEPALTSLCSRAPFLKKLAGVRCRAAVTLLVGDEAVYKEEGEVQWTDYGISGVVVFSLSRFAVRALKEKKQVSVSLDLMPDLSKDQLCHLLKEFRDICGYKDGPALLNGLLSSRLSPVILREARIDENCKAGDWNDEDIRRLVKAVKGFMLRIHDHKSYEKAQVTMGGVPLDELTDHLESVFLPGLFFAGEVVDVDGTCGGYNLSWAFASGKAAGMGAKHRLMDHCK